MKKLIPLFFLFFFLVACAKHLTDEPYEGDTHYTFNSNTNHASTIAAQTLQPVTRFHSVA